MNEIYKAAFNAGKSREGENLLNALVFLTKTTEGDAKGNLGLPTTPAGAKVYVDKLLNALKGGATVEEPADLKAELYA